MKRVFVVAVLAAAASACGGGPENDAELELRTELGEPVTLLDDGALGLRYFPDMAVVTLEEAPRLRLLVTAAGSTYLLAGEDITRLGSAMAVLALEPGPPGSFDNGYAGISGAYRDPSGRLYGFYHAEDHEGLPILEGSGLPGFHSSVGVAVSDDGGVRWEKLGPVIQSSQPKGWIAYEGQGDSGAAMLSVALEKSGRYLYMYYQEHSRVDGRGIVVCMARADLDAGPPLPGRWFKYRDGEFREPGLGGRDSPIVTAEGRDDAEPLFPHVVRSESLDRYVMLLNVSYFREYAPGVPLELGGTYVAFSRDGVRWSEPEVLFHEPPLPLPGQPVSWEPTLVWDPGSTTDGWLVYGYSAAWPSPHYMKGRRMSLRAR